MYTGIDRCAGRIRGRHYTRALLITMSWHPFIHHVLNSSIEGEKMICIRASLMHIKLKREIDADYWQKK